MCSRCHGGLVCIPSEMFGNMDMLPQQEAESPFADVVLADGILVQDAACRRLAIVADAFRRLIP